MVTRRPLITLLGTLLGMLALGASACQAGAPTAAPVSAVASAIAQELAVGFKPGAQDDQKAALRARYGATGVLRLGPGAEVWTMASAHDARRAALSLSADAAIAFAEPNTPKGLSWSPRDEVFASDAPATGLAPQPAQAGPQWEARGNADPDTDKQWYLTDSGFLDVWGTSTGAGVTVAVIDSGVDPAHPDLQPNLLPMIDEVAARGRQDLSYGRDYAGKDGNGHGTHVAGLIGAVANNGLGIRGAASGVKLLPIKVTSALGETDDVTIAKGIFDAVDQGAQVINLSIGGPDPSLLLLEALNYAFSHNVAVVIASGNESRDVNFPAAFDGVIAVGALTSDGRVTSYSNFGPKLVLCAPGGGKAGGWEGPAIYSTTPTYPCHITQTDGNVEQYGYLAGTSMATPLVTAAVALILAHSPGLAPAQLRTRLAATARDLGAAGYDDRSGFGALDAKRAFDYGRKP